MLYTRVLLITLLLGISSAFPFDLSDLVKRQSACATGVHIIVARASTEAQGEGIIGNVATGVKNKIPGSDSEAVVYPATLNNYQSSEGQGTAAMTKLIQNYVTRCPNTKIVLMGYSQGGQVTFDTICGTSESGFTTTSPLASQYAKNVVAVVTMGEPSHMAGQSYNAGTSVRNGIFLRSNLAACAAYASKTQSYCDTGDVYCDSGNDTSVHPTYVNRYGTVAVNFVVSKAT